MKRILAIALATLLTLCGVLSASAATQPRQPERTVYVASRNVPKAAAEYIRDWFSKYMPAQDICDQTKLTVEQVKKVRICPAFTVEPFEMEDYKNYYFPLIYGDTFVGTLRVYWNEWDGGSGYSCSVNGRDDPFIGALNTLLSSASAPMMLVVTNDGYFALDSKNKVTLLQSFIPSSDTEIEKQKLAIPKM